MRLTQEIARQLSNILRRIPFAHRDESERQIADMLDKGIIRESTSPWSVA